MSVRAEDFAAQINMAHEASGAPRPRKAEPPKYCKRCCWNLYALFHTPATAARFEWPYRCPACGFTAGRTCDCGTTFVASSYRSRQRYCSAKCARRGETLRAGERRERRRQKVCRQCRQPFRGTRRDAAYCSSPCRQSAYRHRVTATRGSTREPLTPVTADASRPAS